MLKLLYFFVNILIENKFYTEYNEFFKRKEKFIWMDFLLLVGVLMKKIIRDFVLLFVLCFLFNRDFI